NAVICAFALCSRTLFYDVVFPRFQTTDSRVLVLMVAFASLVVPTTCMGFSMPLLARAVAADPVRSITRLYAADVVGAALGCVVTTWLLVGTLGYPGALRVGAAVSALAALFGAFCAWLTPDGPVPAALGPVDATGSARRLGTW